MTCTFLSSHFFDAACQKAFPFHQVSTRSDSPPQRKASADEGQATPQTASDCDSLAGYTAG